jgi:RimJ/RimL family protein N-acetyltransferase
MTPPVGSPHGDRGDAPPRAPVDGPGRRRRSPRTKDRAATEDRLRWTLRSYERDGIGLRVAQLIEEGRSPAGAAWLCGRRREVEPCYCFLRRLWGRGLATEAARACRDYGFRRLDYPKLISPIAPANFASRRVAEKAGMRLEREIVWRDRAACVYAIERPDTDAVASGLP